MTNNAMRRGLGMANNTTEHNAFFRMVLEGITSRLPKKYAKNVQIEVSVKDPNGSGHVEPDVSLWRRSRWSAGKLELEDLLLVVEVARSPRNVGYAAKAIMKAFNFEPTMEEGFIFNYQKNEWIRYSRLENGEIVAEKADWSRVLNRFLDPLTRVSDTDWDELKL